MYRLFISFLFAIFILVLAGNTTKAQNWSSEQKDVWAGVEKYWQAEASGNAQSFLDYFDDSYMGWSYNTKVPQDKASTRKWIEQSMKNNSTVLFTLSPLVIWVNGDFAYVHYYYSEIEKDNETQKNQTSDGNWTDILMKKNGKWLLVGDHGGRTSRNPQQQQ